MKKAFLVLVLAATMGGCIHRTSSRIPVSPAFPVVTTPLPQGADAWVCESRNGDSFQVCDAIAIKGEMFTRLAYPDMKLDILSGYVRVDQPNGLIVYWRAKVTQ